MTKLCRWSPFFCKLSQHSRATFSCKWVNATEVCVTLTKRYKRALKLLPFETKIMAFSARYEQIFEHKYCATSLILTFSASYFNEAEFKRRDWMFARKNVTRLCGLNRGRMSQLRGEAFLLPRHLHPKHTTAWSVSGDPFTIMHRLFSFSICCGYFEIKASCTRVPF